MWSDIVMIMMSCVMANHLGLIEAIEKSINHKIPILNCPKCASFWLTLAYCVLITKDVIMSFAISFLMAMVALFFDIILGLIDNLYYKVYEWVYRFQSSNFEDTKIDASDNSTKNTTSREVSEVWMKILKKEEFA